jgi:hypothetical protein
VIRN